MSVQIAVGAFLKSTGAAPASQAVPIAGNNWAVGTTPKAFIMWTIRTNTAGALQDHHHFSVGLTTGASESRSISSSSTDAADVSDVAVRRANKALTIVGLGDSSAATVAECDLSSFAADTVNLSWTTNDGNATLIGFMALGGADLQAKLVKFSLTTGTGSQSVTGAGFQPELVLFAGGINLTNVPLTLGSGGVFLGAATASAQWSLGSTATSEQGTSATRRNWASDRCIMMLAASSDSVFLDASFTSMDADGFTINKVTNSNSFNMAMAALCLRGASFAVGNAAKPTTPAPAAQQVSGLGFFPFGVLFAGTGGASTGIQAGGGLSLGATSGSGEDRCVGQADADNLGTTDVQSIHDSKVQSHLISDAGAIAIQAAATTSSLLNGEFNLSWDPNDARASRLLYVAIGEVNVDARAQISFVEFSVPDVGAGQQPYAMRANVTQAIPGLAGRGHGVH